MYLSDNPSVPSIATGDYGCLRDILVVPSLYVSICIGGSSLEVKNFDWVKSGSYSAWSRQ
jgi:hypothetical protein